jgi:AcrR family transcriptional regulator
LELNKFLGGIVLEKTLNKRELQAIETQKKLLETSIDLIIKNGYDNVTVSEICSACNVAKGTFYIYFESKKDIVIKILTDINHDMLSEKVWNDTSSATEQFMEYIEIYMKAISRQGVDFTRVFLTIIIQQNFEDKAVKANLHEEIVCRIISRGIEEGEFRRDISMKTFYKYLRAYIFGIMMDWCAADGKYSIEEEGQKAIRIFLDMMRYKD